MLNIFFKVKNQIISRLDNVPLVEESKKYVTANFDFSKDWEGYNKTITFRSDKGTPFNVELKDNKCLVPWEVLFAPHFSLSAFGTDSDNTLITTNEIEIKILESGFDENGQVPGTPTPTQWEIYKQEIEDIIEDFKESGGGGGSVEGAELVKNKIQEINSSSTEIQYPSAKAVYNLFQNTEYVDGVTESVVEYIKESGIVFDGGSAK